MPKPRSPLAKAKATGQADKHPERFKNRKQPKSKKLATPPTWMNKHEKKAWNSFKKELPWLCESDRAHMEIVCKIRGKLISGDEVGIQALNALRSAIAQMGGNPSDRSKIEYEDNKEEDASEAYFH